jgi:hypothetical protein
MVYVFFQHGIFLFIAFPLNIATFLKVSLGTVHNVVSLDSSAIILSVPEGLTLDSNDWAGSMYRKVFSVRLPNACIQALVRDRDEWLEAARLQFDIDMDQYSAPAGWQAGAKAQKDFITKQDHTTGRLSHFLESVVDGGLLLESSFGHLFTLVQTRACTWRMQCISSWIVHFQQEQVSTKRSH